MDVPSVKTLWYLKIFYAEESIQFQNICGFRNFELDLQGHYLGFPGFPTRSHPKTKSDVLSDNSLVPDLHKHILLAMQYDAQRVVRNLERIYLLHNNCGE
jgi:hypothetical protein